MAINSADVTAGTNATATQYNNLRKDNVMGYILDGAETDGATITIDWSDATKGKLRKITLGGNRTLVFSNATVGQYIRLRIAQDGTGSRTITWPSGCKFNSATTPVLTTTASRIDIFDIWCSATDTYDVFQVGVDMG